MKALVLALADGLEKLVDFLSKVAVVAMTGLVLVQIVQRYVLAAPFSWVEEMTVFLMIWMAFMGAAVAVRRGGHIAMTLLVERMPAKWARALFYLSTGAIIVFAAIVAWQGFRLVDSVGQQRSAALGLPMTIPYMVVPLGAVLIMVMALAQALEPPRPVAVDVT